MFSVEWEDIYHLGMVVPDLHQAMDELSSTLGLSWPLPQSRTRRFRGPTGTFDADLRFVYSRQGPPYLELIEGIPGTPWDTTPGRLHHVGIWVDHLEQAARQLVETGAPIELTYDTEDLQSFTYHLLAPGIRVELVDSARRPGVEAWIRGEPTDESGAAPTR